MRFRGRVVRRDLWAREVLWYEPCPDHTLLLVAVWDWFVAFHGDRPTWPERPWYATNRTPSFADALATLRRDTWWLSIFGGSPAEPINPENAAAMLAVLAEAA
jgi:hypothetical protein